jgi:preprotein translocase subunit SecG
MNLLLNLVVAAQIIAALVMIGLVLIQHGKGADMGASFGSGASGSLFGATGSANFLSRSTAVCAAVFFACTLALAFISNDRTARGPGSSVLDQPAGRRHAGRSGGHRFRRHGRADEVMLRDRGDLPAVKRSAVLCA